MLKLTGTWLNNYTDKYATIESEPLSGVYVIRYRDEPLLIQRWSERELLMHWTYLGDETDEEE